MAELLSLGWAYAVVNGPSAALREMAILSCRARRWHLKTARSANILVSRGTRKRPRRISSMKKRHSPIVLHARRYVLGEHCFHCISRPIPVSSPLRCVRSRRAGNATWGREVASAHVLPTPQGRRSEPAVLFSLLSHTLGPLGLQRPPTRTGEHRFCRWKGEPFRPTRVQEYRTRIQSSLNLLCEGFSM